MDGIPSNTAFRNSVCDILFYSIIYSGKIINYLLGDIIIGEFIRNGLALIIKFTVNFFVPAVNLITLDNRQMM
jgi:hypothetical protein